MQELKGMPVAEAITEQISWQMKKLTEKQRTPKLTVVRIGEQGDDIAYEKGIRKCFAAVKAAVEVMVLPPEVTQGLLEKTIVSLNHDASVDGLLLLRPLPKHLSQERIKDIVAREKDVDGMGTVNSAYVYAGNKEGCPPCTAQAVMEILDFYGISLVGKRITIIGRSLVVGKPLAMLLLGRDATVTICHTKTLNLADECKKADILITCAGSVKMVGVDFTHRKQIVIDAGTNVVDGKLCGDVDYEAIIGRVAAITPVPGGIGVVTTAVLLKNTVNNAVR